ncbi:MAG: 3-deoxy-D-manno-octulosonic acid transferase [Elusimicrobiales bacterium]|nr:3-deoxy-D-manno-octulosonic acid transferase [Elusimicrobiales bacterium]
MGYILLFFYNLITPLIAVLYLLFFYLSPRRRLLKKLNKELKERFSLLKYPRLTNPIWIHAASVGEVKALFTLLDKLKSDNPNSDIIITSSTAAGREAAKKLTEFSYLLPLDFFPLILKFINKIKPKMLLVAETELWPNMLYLAGRLNIKTFLINARLSEKSFKSYNLISPLVHLILKNVNGIFCQSESDAQRYKKIIGKRKRIECTGNIKYDNIRLNSSKDKEIRKYLDKMNWKKVKIITAGSTWRAEDKIMAKAYLFNKRTILNLKLVLAPRHPETAHETASMLDNVGIHYIKWSDRTNFKYNHDIDCILMDEMGWLNDFYSFCDLTFVGGTLVKIGGHNLLEPSLFSKPVLFGSNIENAKEAAQALIKFGGGFMVKNEKDLSGRISLLIKNPALLRSASKMSKKTLDSLQGATEKTVRQITITDQG